MAHFYTTKMFIDYTSEDYLKSTVEELKIFGFIFTSRWDYGIVNSLTYGKKFLGKKYYT